MRIKAMVKTLLSVAASLLTMKAVRFLIKNEGGMIR